MVELASHPWMWRGSRGGIGMNFRRSSLLACLAMVASMSGEPSLLVVLGRMLSHSPSSGERSASSAVLLVIQGEVLVSSEWELSLRCGLGVRRSRIEGEVC